MAVTRRQVLGFGLGAGALAVGGSIGLTQLASSDDSDSTAQDRVAGSPGSGRRARSTESGGLWSDPASWEAGQVPGPGDQIDIQGPVTIDQDAAVDGLEVGALASLTFDPAASCQLRSTANVVVLGRLVMQPEGVEVEHRLVFDQIDESAFVGEGMQVLNTDVGLWVTGDGQLDLEGTPKLAWTRAKASLAPGDTTVALAETPAGWQVGDEVVVTPTAPPSDESDRPDHPSHTAEIRSITAVDGLEIELSEPLEVEHPTVDLGPAGTMGAEVLNLTRNVMIEGTEGGRSHVMILHASSPQVVRHAALRHHGPNQPDPSSERGTTVGVTGRYALHFHHCAEGSSGSQIDSVVARDCGGHAFVPHESNGTTWTDCISHQTVDHAYWWDEMDQSQQTRFERCVASNVTASGRAEYHNGGFFLGKGPADTNVVRNCVAVNIVGSGFLWYAGSEGDWTAEGLVAHNTSESGIRVWQNNTLAQTIHDVILFHNHEFGIDHGAYGNAYGYERGTLVGNGSGAMMVRAVSAMDDAGRGLRFRDLYCDAAGADYGIILPDGSAVEPALATVVENCTVRNATHSGIYVVGSYANIKAEIRDCDFDGNELWLDPAVGEESEIYVIDSDNGAVKVVHPSQADEQRPEWNAAVVPL